MASVWAIAWDAALEASQEKYTEDLSATRQAEAEALIQTQELTETTQQHQATLTNLTADVDQLRNALTHAEDRAQKSETTAEAERAAREEAQRRTATAEATAETLRRVLDTMKPHHDTQ